MTFDIQLIAIFLLIGRIISVIFILFVITLQARLFGTMIDFQMVPNLSNYQRRNVYLARKVLFALSIVILAGNLIPIIIDSITILDANSLGRNPNIPFISVGYALSNATTAAVSSLMIWALYKIASLGSTR